MTRASSPVNNGKAKIALGDDTALTLSHKGRGNPFDPANYGEIVKPGELVDIVELSPLTLADRRIYNLLIANAWERISEPVIHRIAKTATKGTHQGNKRIESSVLRTMGTIPIVTIRTAGQGYKRHVPLLGAIDHNLEQDRFMHSPNPAILNNYLS